MIGAFGGSMWAFIASNMVQFVGPEFAAGRPGSRHLSANQKQQGCNGIRNRIERDARRILRYRGFPTSLHKLKRPNTKLSPSTDRSADATEAIRGLLAIFSLARYVRDAACHRPDRPARSQSLML